MDEVNKELTEGHFELTYLSQCFANSSPVSTASFPRFLNATSNSVNLINIRILINT